MSSLLKKLTTRKLQGPEQEPVILNRRRVYIFPTRYGAMLTILLALMLIGSINYNNSLGFALTFLLGSVAIISMLHAHRNLANLQLACGNTQSVFTGKVATFPLIIRNPDAIDKISIQFSNDDCAKVFSHIPAASTITAYLKTTTRQRGKLSLSQLKVSTEYPLRLFQAWSWVHLPCSCTIYPAAEKNAPIPVFEDTGLTLGNNTNRGREEFESLRHYQPGDAIKSIAWKQSARGTGIYTKQFSSTTGNTRWLNWETAESQNLEHRLSRLCAWVIQCENSTLEYGLRIPGREIAPGKGHHHRHLCLSALATFGQ